MLFDTKFLAALLAISGVNASRTINSRAAASNYTLYAYGTNITGLNVFYADGMNNDSVHFCPRPDSSLNDFQTLTIALGLAYIGNAAPTGASVASNITCILHIPESFTFNTYKLPSLYL